MTRTINVALMLGLAWGAAGCADDLLTTVPEDRISDEIFWKTETDFVYAVNAVYREVLSDHGLYLDAATDISYSQQYWAPSGLWARGTEVATSGYTSGFWTRFYRGIARANDVLDHLENAEFLSATARAQIEGQARFLRGYFYHELLWMFGDVPLLTRVTTVAEAREVARAPREEVIAQVLADLTAAAEKLPNTWPAASRGRATKGAALAYKARAALYEASYQKYAGNNLTKATPLFRTALEAAQAVQGLGIYQLYPNFRTLFTSAGEGSSEVIFDHQRVKGQNGWAAWRNFAPASQGGAGEFTTPTRVLVDKFYMKDGLPITQSPLYDPDPVKMYENRDPRFYATVIYPTAEFNGAVINTFPSSTTADRLDASNFYNTHTGYYWLKYLDPPDRADPTNSGINNILMRYADVLLMYAEAKIELGEIDGTVATALNALRTRAGMPHITLGSQAAMIDLVRNERAVELAHEGHRMADIRRWRIGMQVMPGRVSGIDYMQGGQKLTARSEDTRLFTDREYLFPIPATERNLNKNLTQNPGF